MTSEMLVLLILVGVIALFAVVELAQRLLRRKEPPKPAEPTPPSVEPPTNPELIAVDVFIPPQLLGATPWFDPAKWPPFSFPAGSVLAIRPIVKPGTGNIVPIRYDFIAYDSERSRIVWRAQMEPEDPVGFVVWNGELFIGGGCGDLAPVPYRIVAMMTLSDRTIQQKQATIFAVTESACRQRG